ncbi:MAG: hypothetical protein M1570_03450 [Chloroflexi bacterium]|nr:hypothetical protein [Chloroflexota bacterium]
MKVERILIAILALALMLALGVQLGQAQVQPPVLSPQDQAPNAPDGPMDARIPIQGRLTDAGGSPLNGNYLIKASIYDVATGGTARCTDTDTVTVTNGLFFMDMDFCTSNDINGDKLYLGIKVESDPEMTPRQVLNGVPYAWSLRPGAVIGGDIKQIRTGDGLVKAAAYVNCSGTNSSLVRYFNNVGGTISVSDGATAGTCTIDFGFQVNDRFWSVAVPTNGARMGTCSNVAPNGLNCYRWDHDGTASNGTMIVIVY